MATTVTTVTSDQLITHGVDTPEAEHIARRVNGLLCSGSPASAWRTITEQLLKPSHPLEVHKLLFESVFTGWDTAQGPPPAWIPTDQFVQTTNIAALMNELVIDSYEQLLRWSIEHRDRFWEMMLRKLDIRMRRAPHAILDLSADDGVESPRWLVGARFNMADNCFLASADATAILYQPEGGELSTMTCLELEALTNRVANGIVAAGLRPKEAVAICMPMSAESVAIYLGLVRAGCVVVSIADSFAADEIAKRIRIAGAKAIFTQDRILRGGKQLPMYAKVAKADGPRAVVLPATGSVAVDLRDQDVTWQAFLSDDDAFETVVCAPDDDTNILFSSGTTGDPKAIPWTQLTPIKCAADGYLHHNIQSGDVVAWPTNLGWMMGPWLIYASLINRAAMAIYYGSPTGGEFGRFVQDAKVTMLGVVPSLVRVWRDTRCMKGLDWSAIKGFSSTGECSETDDMLYLMALAGYRPIIEYCGGTEIGGGYITGTMVQPSSPATFSTPALGLDLVILDEDGHEADQGELFIVPPSIGLSQKLLNRDHQEVYFEGTPRGPSGQTLRRHGDHMERLGGGYLRAHGRVDDTMNLSGIKVSSAEIERVVNTVEGVSETAAIAVPPPGGGPSRLVIYAVLSPPAAPTPDQLKASMRSAIHQHLNPLFKVHDVVPVDTLPRTASNKVMRRELRAAYHES